MYKSNWEKQREKGFELRLDSLSILTAKSKTDLASVVSYSKNSLQHLDFSQLQFEFEYLQRSWYSEEKKVFMV